MAFNYRNTPFFSWSPAREKMFHECELCYIMHYYTAHQGWQNNSNVEARAAYRWKKATKIENFMLYNLIESLIEKVYYGEPKNLADLRNSVLNHLNECFHNSINYKESWYKKPNSINMLYELVYETKLEDEIINNITNQLDIFLKNFICSKLAEELKQDKCQLINVRNEFKGGYSYFNHEKLGIRIYAGVQVVHEREDGKIIATVFKTDNNPSSLSQIGAIAKVIEEVTGKDIKNVIVRDEYLNDGTYKEFPIDDKTLQLTQLSIEDSVGLMKQFLVDGDIKRNEFLGFRDCEYTRSLKHHKAADNNYPMHKCPYCEAVKRDLELYPNGYDPNVKVLEYGFS